MNLKTLEKKLVELNQPGFRLNQIKKAYFDELKNSWDQVSTLSKDLRDNLKSEIDWDDLTLDKLEQDKKDHSKKALLKTKDNLKIETVLIQHQDKRRTVCVSSQAGCPLGCAFCATGQSGFRRNLLAAEILNQIIFWSRKLKEKNEKITNVVFMGMGEPLLNLDEVLEAIKLINDKTGLNLAARHISISTVGLIPGINKIKNFPLQINLAISLHAPNDRLRDQLIPTNKKYPIQRIFDALDIYLEETNRRVMVEYLMIDGVNDFQEQARELVELLAKRKLYYLNLIPYNETDKFKTSSPEKIKKFTEILSQNHIPYTLRRRFGSDIAAACGQLAGK